MVDDGKCPTFTPMTDLKLGKQDRLKRRKVIQHLFAKGTPVKGYPVLILFSPVEQDGPKPYRAGFSVPKRKLRRAVDRNLIKRRMREAYRLHRQLLPPGQDGRQIAMMCIYMTPEMLSFVDIEKGMIKALRRLSEKISD